LSQISEITHQIFGICEIAEDLEGCKYALLITSFFFFLRIAVLSGGLYPKLPHAPRGLLGSGCGISPASSVGGLINAIHWRQGYALSASDL
jgi:hypothetical protein